MSSRCRRGALTSSIWGLFGRKAIALTFGQKTARINARCSPAAIFSEGPGPVGGTPFAASTSRRPLASFTKHRFRFRPLFLIGGVRQAQQNTPLCLLVAGRKRSGRSPSSPVSLKREPLPWRPPNRQPRRSGGRTTADPTSVKADPRSDRTRRRRHIATHRPHQPAA